MEDEEDEDRDMKMDIKEKKDSGRRRKGRKRKGGGRRLGRDGLRLIAEAGNGGIVGGEGGKSIDSRKEKSALETTRAGGENGMRNVRELVEGWSGRGDGAAGA